MPLPVNANPFEDPAFRKQFLKLVKREKGVDKACRALEINSTTLYEYRREARNPDKAYDANREFIKAIEVIKQSLRKNK